MKKYLKCILIIIVFVLFLILIFNFQKIKFNITSACPNCDNYSFNKNDFNKIKETLKHYDYATYVIYNNDGDYKLMNIEDSIFVELKGKAEKSIDKIVKEYKFNKIVYKDEMCLFYNDEKEYGMMYTYNLTKSNKYLKKEIIKEKIVSLKIEHNWYLITKAK